VKWNEKRQRIFEEHAAEAFRECGILWFVFSALDRLVEGRLSVTWIMANFAGAIAAWSFGMYIELKDKRHG
jgi:hypothetical protein